MDYRVENKTLTAPWDRYSVMFNACEVGWIRYSDTYIPIVYIHRLDHAVDKEELSKAIKEIWPDTMGRYFLVTELFKPSQESKQTKDGSQ